MNDDATFYSGVIVDPHAAHHATQVPLRTIQRWAANGRICNHGNTQRLRVDLGEVLQLAALRDTRTSHRLPATR